MTLHLERCYYANECDILYHFNHVDYPEEHDHDYWEIFIVCSGSYKHFINGEEHINNVGDCYIIRPKDTHYVLNNSNNASHINVSVKSAFMENVLSLYSSTYYADLVSRKFCRFKLNELQIQSIIDRGSNLLKEQVSLDASFTKRYILTKLLDYYIEQNDLFKSNKPEWLRNLISEIGRVQNLDWRVEDVVNATHFSRTHLNREFNKYLNCTVLDYLIYVKINHALEMLRHTDKPIKEIAHSLGFLSVSHFNKLIKEKIGLKPLQIRKNKSIDE